MEVGRGVGVNSPISSSSSLTISSPWRATVPTPCEKTKVIQKYPESLSLLPISWDVLLSIYRELVRLINRLPFKKKLIVCIVYRGNKFRLDLGEVKAAGVICLVGLGLSLGTLLLYRLYFRIIVPFLNSVWAAKGKDALIDDEYTLYLEPSDSEVDEKMGNSHSKKCTPSVYYAPGYGVALGARPPSLNVDCDDITQEGVRLRPRKSHHIRSKSPSPASDKDSAIGAGGSEMSQSFYSENSINRDSFYSTCTAESGFDDLGFLDDLKSSKLNGSLKENYSPNSLKERNLQMLFRAHHGYDAGLNSLGRSAKPGLDTLSDCSSERSGILSSRSCRSSCSDEDSRMTINKTNVDPLMEKLTGSTGGSSIRTNSRQSQISQDKSSRSLPKPRTEDLVENNGAFLTSLSESDRVIPSPRVPSNESSPYHRSAQQRSSRGRSPLRAVNQHHQPNRLQAGWGYVHDLDTDYDPSLDASESIRSFNSSADEIDWDAEDDPRDRMSLMPQFQQSLSDLQFKQSLMQRIHEWSNFAEEYSKSRSPTPDCSPIRFVRRSRSLDRHIGDPSLLLVPDSTEAEPLELDPTTEKNLETLEYELHGIQGEFESITSRLHELIQRGNADLNPSASPKSSKPSHPSVPGSSGAGSRVESAPRQIDALRKMRTSWDHVPSSACSNTSGRSSRASSVSVEYAWDLGDYKHNNSSVVNTAGERLRAGSVSRSEGGADVVQPADLRPLTDDCLGFGAPEAINIGLPVIISDYAEQEWKGETDKAKIIREGYSKIPSLLSCHRMCVIRGDNYCSLRSVLFQVLINELRVTKQWSGIIGIMDNLHDLFDDATVGFSDWTFANRLPHHRRDMQSSLSKCALSLYATIEEVCNLPSREEREKRTTGLFNTSTTFDLELMEGLKVMMLLTLVDLKQKMDDGEDVPIFVPLLFARDTSENISQFLKNHLNCVGDSGGLEQVEMCLLGYTLGIRIRVLRLAQCGQQDFDCVFPEDVPADWPVVSLIAEDDRHYNVPIP